jgi:hypothetical protein
MRADRVGRGEPVWAGTALELMTHDKRRWLRRAGQPRARLLMAGCAPPPPRCDPRVYRIAVGWQGSIAATRRRGAEQPNHPPSATAVRRTEADLKICPFQQDNSAWLSIRSRIDLFWSRMDRFGHDLNWPWDSRRLCVLFSSCEKTREVSSNRDDDVRRFGAGWFGAGVGYRPGRHRPGTAVSLVPRGSLGPGLGRQLGMECLPRRPSSRYGRLGPQSRLEPGATAAVAAVAAVVAIAVAPGRLLVT